MSEQSDAENERKGPALAAIGFLGIAFATLGLGHLIEIEAISNLLQMGGFLFTFVAAIATVSLIETLPSRYQVAAVGGTILGFVNIMFYAYLVNPSLWTVLRPIAGLSLVVVVILGFMTAIAVTSRMYNHV